MKSDSCKCNPLLVPDAASNSGSLCRNESYRLLYSRTKGNKRRPRRAVLAAADGSSVAVASELSIGETNSSVWQQSGEIYTADAYIYYNDQSAGK